MRIRILAFAALLLAGCGYVAAGTWEDDPDNWGRAFSSTKPPDVRVVHSKYWRSPHFTYEYQYFFHMEGNDALWKQLSTDSGLARLDGDAATEAVSDFFSDKPNWFLPESAEAYEVWVFADQPESHFKAFVHRRSGDLFLNDYQY